MSKVKEDTAKVDNTAVVKPKVFERLRVTPRKYELVDLGGTPSNDTRTPAERNKDPRVQQAFISIVRVEVTNDLSYCTVQVSAIEGLDRAKEAVKGLKSASGFIRRELGHRLHLRHVPELIFHATDSIEYSANISRILNSLDIKEDEEENDESV